MKIKYNKAEVASKQLDVAINLLFTDQDAIAVRSLASSAHSIFFDLVENKEKNSSWKSKAIKNGINNYSLTKKEAIHILNSAYNFLKHADTDPESELEFDQEENDHVIFFATLECGELGHELSILMQKYQIWYLAMYPNKIDKEIEHTNAITHIFPGIQELSREASLSKGLEYISIN